MPTQYIFPTFPMPGLTHPKYEGESWEHQIWMQIVTTFCVALFRGNRDKYFLSPDEEKISISQWGDIIFCISRRGENVYLSMGRYYFMPKGTIYIHADVHHMLHLPTWRKSSSLNGEILFSSQWAYIFSRKLYFRAKRSKRAGIGSFPRM